MDRRTVLLEVGTAVTFALAGRIDRSEFDCDGTDDCRLPGGTRSDLHYRNHRDEQIELDVTVRLKDCERAVLDETVTLPGDGEIEKEGFPEEIYEIEAELVGEGATERYTYESERPEQEDLTVTVNEDGIDISHTVWSV